jgi:hypothetical protein
MDDCDEETEMAFKVILKLFLKKPEVLLLLH